MIKAIIFDLDDTLYDYYKFSNKALDKTYQVLKKNKNISKKKFLQVLEQSKKEIRKELKHSPDSHNRIIYFQRLGNKLGLDQNFILKLYDAYYGSVLKNIKPRKGVLRTFKELRKRKIKIVILTNEVVEIQLRKVQKMKLLKYVDCFIASEDIGIDKPNKKIFLETLKRIKLKSSEVLMVGDSEKEDIVGADNAKIKSILMTKRVPKTTKAYYIINEIPEVLKILNSLK